MVEPPENTERLTVPVGWTWMSDAFINLKCTLEIFLQLSNLLLSDCLFVTPCFAKSKTDY